MIPPGHDAVPLPRTEDWSALKEAVKRFEHAWLEGPRPDIDDFLPADEPLRRRILVELVHIDLELRLKAGETARVEEYLDRHKELAGDRSVALDLITAECEFRQRHEPNLHLSEYLSRFPQLHA